MAADHVGDVERPAEAAGALVTALRDLHVQAGKPSMRSMAAEIGTVSHTTVASAFKGAKVPSWPVVASIVTRLGGDEEAFRALWVAATAGDSYTESVDDVFLNRYRRIVAQYHGKIEPPNFEQRHRVPMHDVYVLPMIARWPSSVSDDAIQNLNIWQFDDEIRHSVLLGNAGSGKTVACNAIMYRHATDVSRSVAFLVTLRDFASAGLPSRSVVSYIEARLETFYQCAPPSGWLERQLVDGDTLVIFDGLDELLISANRADVTSIIELFCSEYPHVQVMVTSRLVGYEETRLDPDVFTRYLLTTFNDEDVERYVANWFALNVSLDSATAKRHAEAFMIESSYVADLRKNPLMLGFLCSLYKGEGSIPHNWPDLYERVIEMMLSTWDARRGIQSGLPARYLVRSTLNYLAFSVLSREDYREAIRESELLQEVAEFLLDRIYEDRNEALDVARQFVEFCKSRAGVFSNVGVTRHGEPLYMFTHRAFLEYFSASYIARQHATPEELAHKLIPYIMRGEWRVVARLALQINDRTTERGAERTVTAIMHELNGVPALDERRNIVEFLNDCLSVLALSPSLVRAVQTLET